MIGRRAVIVGAVAGAGALASGAAEACTLIAYRPRPFEDRVCRQRIHDWVSLLNRGPDMSDQEIATATESLHGWVDDDLVREVLADRVPPSPEVPIQFYKEFRLSVGHLDPRPIRISELNLLRRVRNRATYQFTLDRYTYHPADEDGCNGMFPRTPEGYDTWRTAYLATFRDNVLQVIKQFPEWHLEGQE